MRRTIARLLVLVVLLGGLVVGTGLVAAAKTFITIPTANVGGAFYPAGAAIASLLNEKLGSKGIVASAQASAGSPENLRMMMTGEANAAILVGDIASDAFHGRGAFSGTPYQNLRAITALWSNPIQIVALKKANIRSLSDLRGKRISVGQPGSGQEVLTKIALYAGGLDVKDVVPEYLGYSQSSEAMRDGKIVAAHLGGGVPAPEITSLFAGPTPVELVSFNDREVARVVEKYPYYFKLVIPPGTYPKQDKPVITVATTAFLAVDANVDENVVYDITKTIYENLDYLAKSYNGLSGMSLEGAVQGIDVPIHPGALRYFKERGLKISE